MRIKTRPGRAICGRVAPEAPMTQVKAMGSGNVIVVGFATSQYRWDGVQDG